jgi:hypothetical protein
VLTARLAACQSIASSGAPSSHLPSVFEPERYASADGVLSQGMIRVEGPAMFDVVISHIDGSVEFDYRISARQYHLHVERECLVTVFRSDGTQEGNEISIRENAEQILRVAANKVRRGSHSPIQIHVSDF